MAVASDPVDATLKSFTRWASAAPPSASGDPDPDAGELRRLLGLMRDHIGVDDPAHLAPGDLRELLLEVYPRKVTVRDAEETTGTVPALRHLLAFLTDTGAIAAEAAKRLGRELDEVAPQFADAVMDPKNWGMARSITQAMISDGVDLTNQDTVHRWIARYNQRVATGRPDDDELEDFDLADDAVDGADFDLDDDAVDAADFSLKDTFWLPDRLPPVRLPPEPELAAMSRTAPLLGRARRLAEWVAPGRDVTQDLELTAEDTIAAARELGIEVPVRTDTGAETLPGMPGPPAIISMYDVPELARLWDIAFDAGFLQLDLDGDRMEPGEELGCWPGGSDEEVLGVWATTLPCVLDRLEDDADLDDRLGGLLDFTGVGWALMVMLFLANSEGIPIGVCSGMIREAATEGLAPDQGEEAWQAWIGSHGDPAEYLLGLLQELGAVSLPEQLPGAGAEDGPVTRLTPLGTWAMRDLLLEDDVEIPLLPPPDQMTAADLLAVADGLDEEEFEAEMAAWLELRSPDAAAGELLAAAAEGGPMKRLLAVGTARRLGAAAEPAWRDSLGRPELRPYAKVILTEIAGGEPGVTALPGLKPEAADIAWMLTDTLATMPDDPEELPQQIRDAIPPGQEQQAFDAISLSRHPDAASVLSLIGRHHPDKRIAKAARRSAYKAASRPRPLAVAQTHRIAPTRR